MFMSGLPARRDRSANPVGREGQFIEAAPARRIGPVGPDLGTVDAAGPAEAAGATGPVRCGSGSAISAREDAEIAVALRSFVGARTCRQIGLATDTNAETVRRYLNGASRISASFVARFCFAYGVDPSEVLLRFERPERDDAETDPARER